MQRRDGAGWPSPFVRVASLAEGSSVGGNSHRDDDDRKQREGELGGSSGCIDEVNVAERLAGKGDEEGRGQCPGRGNKERQVTPAFHLRKGLTVGDRLKPTTDLIWSSCPQLGGSSSRKKLPTTSRVKGEEGRAIDNGQ
ncbi:unnamed protein product [Linum trigynum]